MMARRAKANIYPAYLDGSQRNVDMPDCLLHAQSATLTFGPRVPIHFDAPADDLEAATAQIQRAVKKLSCAASSLHAGQVDYRYCGEQTTSR